MASRLITLTKGVVLELNEPPEPRPFSIDFKAIRSYLARYTPEDLKTLCITVVPTTTATVPISRTDDSDDHTVTIAVQKKITFTNDIPDGRELDALLELVEEIADYFAHRTLVSVPSATWVSTETTAPYSVEHLKQDNVFTGLAAITFRQYR